MYHVCIIYVLSMYCLNTLAGATKEVPRSYYTAGEWKDFDFSMIFNGNIL